MFLEVQMLMIMAFSVNLFMFSTADKIAQWNNEGKEAHLRWIENFQHFSSQKLSFKNFSKVVEYAPVERIFAHMNKIWTSEKNAIES